MILNWAAIGATGEVLGAIAVFITLAYLAFQVRQARMETRRALSQGRTESNRELIRLGLEDNILEAHVKAEIALAPQPPVPLEMLMSKAGLTREEATRVIMVYIAYWNYVVQMVPVVEGLSTPERQLFNGFIRNRYRRPGVYGEIYELWTKHAEPDSEVVAYVDAILAT
jgi:hypothetical protein